MNKASFLRRDYIGIEKGGFYNGKKILIVCILVLVATFTFNLLPVHSEEEIYDSVVRLHVIANSDAEYDQELKLSVRDEILSEAGDIFEGCTTQEEAIARLEEMIPQIKSAAEDRVKAEGYDYKVDVVIGKEKYPTKEYESCTFPAGEYVSLRVIIGDGEGKNWWCCLFPPLCLSAASDKKQNEDAFISVGLTDEQYKIITETDTPKYKVRFKVLEVIQRVFK